MAPNKISVAKTKAPNPFSVGSEKALSQQILLLKDQLDLKVQELEALRAEHAQLKATHLVVLAESHETSKKMEELLARVNALEMAQERPLAKRPVVSYADISATPPAPGANIVPAKRGAVGAPRRPLTVEEVARIQKGFGPAPRTEFDRLYFEGQKKNRLGLIRDTFRFAGVEMRHIRDVSFVGKSVMMVITARDYTKTLVEVLRTIHLKHLVGFDELEAKWMARTLREKGNPEAAEAKKLAVDLAVARFTARRDAVGNKNPSLFGYYSRVILELKDRLSVAEPPNPPKNESSGEADLTRPQSTSDMMELLN